MWSLVIVNLAECVKALLLLQELEDAGLVASAVVSICIQNRPCYCTEKMDLLDHLVSFSLSAPT